MAYIVRSGIDTFALWKAETAYATDPGTWTSGAAHFGITQTVTPTPKRNLKKIRGLTGALPTTNAAATSRDAQQIVGGNFEVGLSVEFQPQTFNFMELVMGSKSGSDPYYYPQQSASTEADKKKYVATKSFSLMTRYDFNGSTDNQDKVWIYSGLIVNSFSLKAAKGEVCTCSLDCVGATMTASVTDVETAYPYTALSSADVYSFNHASINYGGTALANVCEGFEFRIENEAEIGYGLGSYTGYYGVVKSRDITLTLDLTAESTELFDDMMGAATSISDPVKIETVEIVLEKSASIDATLTLKNCKIEDDSNGMNYGEVTKERVTLHAEYCYMVENQA